MCNVNAYEKDIVLVKVRSGVDEQDDINKLLQVIREIEYGKM